MTVELKEVSEIIMGQSPKGDSYNNDDIGLPLLNGASDYKGNFFNPKKYTSKPTRVALPGDILLGIRATIGNFAYSNDKYCIGRGVAAIRVDETKADKGYILKSVERELNRIIHRAAGSTIKGIKKEDLTEMKLNLPPLVQQKQIAKILDAADAYRQKTKALIEKYDELTQSLFLDMFGDPVTNPKRWEKVLFSDIATFHNGDRGKNYPSQSAFKEEGIPFINAGNLSNYSISAAGLNFISRERYDLLNAGKIIIGDILFCLRGSLGKFAINSTLDIGAIASSLVLIRLNQQVALEYITGLLKSNYIKGLIEKFDNGSSQPNLSAKSVKEFLIPTPPIKLQNQFAKRVQAIEAQKLLAQKELEKAETLFNSLLQKAFKGELTI